MSDTKKKKAGRPFGSKNRKKEVIEIGENGEPDILKLGAHTQRKPGKEKKYPKVRSRKQIPYDEGFLEAANEWGYRKYLEDSYLTQSQVLFLMHFRENPKLVSVSCRKAGISTAAVYDYRNKNVLFAELYQEVINEEHDLVHNAIYQKAIKGEFKMVELYAKAEMKDRGYGKNPEPLEVETVDVEFEDLNDGGAMLDDSELLEFFNLVDNEKESSKTEEDKDEEEDN